MPEYPQPAPAPYPTDTGSVQGASTTDWNQQWNQDWNIGWNYGFNNPQATWNFEQPGFDTGFKAGQQEYKNRQLTSTPNPNPTPLPSQSPMSTPSPDDQLINSIFDPSMSYLNQAESTIQSQQPGVEQDIMAQYGTSKTSLEGEKASGERNLAQSEQKAGTTKMDAASAARRLYQELVQGGRQRFGGASSAGQAYGELTANQLQRNQGNIQQQYGETMQKIDGYKQDLQQKFTSALSELENQKNSAINEAKRYFQDKLLEISRLKAETESNKSMARLQELQNLRNTVMSINLQDYQYKQQLAANNQIQQQQVEQAKQQLLQQVTGGQNAAQAYNPQINNNLAMSMPGGVGTASYTGIARKPEDYTGAISRRYDENYA